MFSSLHRKLFREEQEGRIPGPPSYFTKRGEAAQIHARIQKLVKPQYTIQNNYKQFSGHEQANMD
jgi:hypothetical protein